jgi:hypothetical protein
MDIHKVIDPGWPNKLVQPVPRKQEEHGILFCSHLAVVQFNSKAIARKMETREYTLSAPDESRDSPLGRESNIQNRLWMDCKVVQEKEVSSLRVARWDPFPAAICVRK